MSNTAPAVAWPPLPNPYCEHAAVLVGQKVIVVDEYKTAVLDLTTQKWLTEKPPMVSLRGNNCHILEVAVCGNHISVVCGNENGDSATKILRVNRCEVAPVKYGDEVVVRNTQQDTTEPYQAQVRDFRYQSSIMVWDNASNCERYVRFADIVANLTEQRSTRQLDSFVGKVVISGNQNGLELGTPRSHCAAVAIYNRFLVVLGGYQNGGCSAEVEVLDVVGNVHVRGPRMRVARACFGAAVVGNQIFAVGGKEGTASNCVESISFHSDPVTATARNLLGSNSWITCNDLSLLEARWGHSVVPIAPSQSSGEGGGFVVLGGCGKDKSCLSSAEWVDVESRSVERFPHFLSQARHSFAAVLVPPPLLRGLNGVGEVSEGGVQTLSASGGIMVMGGLVVEGKCLDSVEVLRLPPHLVARCLRIPARPPFPDFPAEAQMSLVQRRQLSSNLEGWVAEAEQVLTQYRQSVTEWTGRTEELRNSGVSAVQEQINEQEQFIRSLRATKDRCLNRCTEQIQAENDEVDAWTLERQAEIHHVRQTLQMLREETSTTGVPPAPSAPPTSEDVSANEPPVYKTLQMPRKETSPTGKPSPSAPPESEVVGANEPPAIGCCTIL